jgi:hypothetical protein
MIEPRSRRVYRALVDDEEPPGLRELPPDVAKAVPGNAAKQVGALSLQKAGDRLVDPKTVLTWLLAGVGAPAGLVGLLVPIRESGSLLPQVALGPWVRRFPVRKLLWVAGAAGQAVAVVAMAIVAATMTGTRAGLAILVALALFALARSVSSITSKDVLGRTIPKGQRGQITGFATVASGLVAITIGVGIRIFGSDEADPVVFAWLLGGAALAWVAAAAVFATIVEAPGETTRQSGGRWLGPAIALLRDDVAFRRFVVTRSLLLVSALSSPFVVALGARETGAEFGQLGPFVVATGVASLVGGPVWGRYADRSSRLVMIAAAGGASGVVILLLVGMLAEPIRTNAWTYPIAYLLLALAHTGVRIGRKTYVVDLAEGDRRTDYVAISNTAIGVLLLVTGGLAAVLAELGLEVALAFLALLGLAGVLVGRALPEVTAHATSA